MFQVYAIYFVTVSRVGEENVFVFFLKKENNEDLEFRFRC